MGGPFEAFEPLCPPPAWAAVVYVAASRMNKLFLARRETANIVSFLSFIKDARRYPHWRGREVMLLTVYPACRPISRARLTGPGIEADRPRATKRQEPGLVAPMARRVNMNVRLWPIATYCAVTQTRLL